MVINAPIIMKTSAIQLVQKYVSGPVPPAPNAVQPAMKNLQHARIGMVVIWIYMNVSLVVLALTTTHLTQPVAHHVHLFHTQPVKHLIQHTLTHMDWILAHGFVRMGISNQLLINLIIRLNVYHVQMPATQNPMEPRISQILAHALAQMAP